MREAVDAVAHHEPHGAGVVIRPDRLGAEFALGRIEPRGDLVQRLVPRNPRELAGALRPGPAHRMQQPVGMMNALGVARDLGADDAGGIGLQLGAAHPADRASRRSPRYRARRPTGNRADRWNAGCRSWLLVHAPIGTIKSRGRREHLSGNHRAKTAAGHALGAEIGPAIGVDGLPVDVARAGPAQETHGCGDVFRPAPLAGDGLMGQMMRRLRCCPSAAACRSAREPRSSR